MRLFLTGHTGFKGSWFVMCAARGGASVHGYALEPREVDLFADARLADLCDGHTIADIRDRGRLTKAMQRAQPDVVVHMAAQPLVRRSYRDPRETFEVNVDGTLALMEAARDVGVPRTLVITTDKVYRNLECPADGFSENAPLGGHDPYSASKAMAEILVASWTSSFGSSGQTVATARAGNVIGGGDRSEDRLIPDIIRAVGQGQAVKLRYPDAVRPWQHVLDVTAGYFTILRSMGDDSAFGSWNLGPDPRDRVTVMEIARRAVDRLGRGSVEVEQDQHPHEAAVLTLNAAKAHNELGWKPTLSATEAVDWTMAWESAVASGKNPRKAVSDQVERYSQLASTASLSLDAG